MIEQSHLVVALVFWGSAALVLYTWLGYPLLVALLARLRRPTTSEPPAVAPPSVTLLIAAWQEESVIAARLEDALALDYPPERLQILVAAEAAPDRTLEIVRAYSGRGIELVTADHRLGKSVAIARALPLVRGDVIAFSDANNRWEPLALRRLVAPFDDPRVGATVGAKQIAVTPGMGWPGGLPIPELRCSGDGAGPAIPCPGHVAAGGTLYWRYEDFLCRQESRLGGCVAGNGEIMAVRRRLMPDLPADTVNEDFFIVLAVARAGFRVAYVPDAHSIERTQPTAGEERTRRARITAGRVRHLADLGALLAAGRPVLAWQVLSHKLLRLVVPWALLLALLTSAMAAVGLGGAEAPPSPTGDGPGSGPLLLGPPWGAVALSLQVAIYAVAALAHLLPPGTRAARIGGAIRYLVEANLATALGTLRGLARGQSPLWTKADRR